MNTAATDGGGDEEEEKKEGVAARMGVAGASCPRTPCADLPAGVTGEWTMFTHDNGGRPFMVRATAGTVQVFAHSEDGEDGEKVLVPWLDGEFEDDTYNTSSAVWQTDNYEAIWVAEEPCLSSSCVPRHDPFGHGHLVVVELAGNVIVVIGVSISQYTLPEPLRCVCSEIGNNDVVYAMLLTDSFMLHIDIMPNDEGVVMLQESDWLLESFFKAMEAGDSELSPESLWMSVEGVFHEGKLDDDDIRCECTELVERSC